MSNPNGSDGLMAPDSKTGRIFRWNVILIFLVVLAVLMVHGAALLKELLILIAGVLFITYLMMGPVNAMDRILQRFRPRMPEALSRHAWLPSVNPRFFSILIVFVAFILAIAAATGMIFPVIGSQVAGFARDLPGYYRQVEEQLEKLSEIRLGQVLFQSVLQQDETDKDAGEPKEIIVRVETVEKTLKEEGERQTETSTGDLFLTVTTPDAEKHDTQPLQQAPVKIAEEPVVDEEEEADLLLAEEADGFEGELFFNWLGESPAEETETESSRPVQQADPPAESVTTPAKETAPGGILPESVQITTETRVIQAEKAPEQKQKTALGQLVNYFQRYASSTFMNAIEVVTTSLTGLIYFLTALVLTFYFLLDGPSLKEGFVGLLPATSRSFARNLLNESHFLLVQFLRVQISFALITGVVLYAIYTLLGLKYAGFLSFFFAVMSLIPVLGPCIGAIPSALVLIFTDQPYFALVIFTLVAGFYLVKQRWLEGRMFESHMSINPVLMLMVMMICLQLTGIGGLLLTIPLACLVTAALHNIRRDATSLDAN